MYFNVSVAARKGNEVNSSFQYFEYGIPEIKKLMNQKVSSLMGLKMKLYLQTQQCLFYSADENTLFPVFRARDRRTTTSKDRPNLKWNRHWKVI